MELVIHSPKMSPQEDYDGDVSKLSSLVYQSPCSFLWFPEYRDISE